MSDVEEPPQKVTKFELSEEYLDEEDMEEGMEEGQEEWLSEGGLTDNEYPEPNTSNTQNTLPNDTATNAQDTSTKSDLEDTLNNMDNSELEAHLVTKAGKEEVKDYDDGNDTDDLLSMLGEENKRNKVLKIVEKKKIEQDAQSSEDDEYIYETSKITKLKVSKNAIITTQKPTKAEPEDLSDDDVTDMSSDEASLMQKIFTVKKNVAAKSTAKPAVSAAKPPVRQTVQFRVTEASHSTPKSTPSKPTPKTVIKPEVKHVIKIDAKKTPVKTENGTPNKISMPASNVPNKLASNVPIKLANTVSNKSATNVPTNSATNVPIKLASNVSTKLASNVPDKLANNVSNKSASNVPIKLEINVPKLESNVPTKLTSERESEEFLEDDFDFNEQDSKDFSKKQDNKQRIMRPERMDEEFPSDEDSSMSEDESLYDELPSSESEDIDEWFTLDIRAERAGDYLPLLGDRAHDILKEQKRHVSSRLATLRQSLAALTESGRQQAEHLRKATLQLAELDAMLKAV